MTSMARLLVYGVLLVLDVIVQTASKSEVESPARITQPPLDTRAQAGFFIFLICKVQGNPKPTVQFHINGKIQKNEGHRKIIRTFDYGASLRQQVQMDNNNDRVECVAQNHLGVETKSAIITVIDSNGEAPVGFPTIITGPIDVLGQIGKSTKIRCEVSADPAARVIWIKNSHFQLDLEDERFQIVGTGSLTIKNIKEKDSGSYECMARNKIGTVISQAGLLQIRNSPMTPQIIEFKNVIEVSIGHGANLTCNAEGYPIPNVFWAVSIGNINNQKAEQRPLSDAKPSVSIIHITDITESAVYTCFATNSMGTVRKTVNIIVKKKPLTPKSLSTREIGSVYALIEWMPVESNPPVDSYTLLIKDISSEDAHLGLRQIANIYISSMKTTETGKVMYNITELKPFTKYEARVVAVNNNIGTSEASSPAAFQTNELPPSTAPRDVYATAISHDSIVVNWKPPLQTNGRITGYKMFYSEKSNAPIGMWTVLRTSDTKYHLNNLIPKSMYSIKVNAYNNAGDGPVSDSVSITVTPGVPPVPQNFRGAGLSSTSIQIMWSAPLMPDGMSLQNYVLKYKEINEENAKMITESLDPDKTQYLIQGLKPGTVYSISLAGRTIPGLGVAAQLTEKTKDENNGSEFPDINIWANNITSESAEICWKVIWDNKNENEISKAVYMLIFDGFESNSVAENASNIIVGQPCCCYTVINLKAGSAYNFWIKPQPFDDKIGIDFLNLKSKTLTIITVDKIQVPGMPVGEALVVMGSTAIKVSWKGPTMLFDQVKYYIVRWKSREDDPKKIKTPIEGSMKIDADKNSPEKIYYAVINNLIPNLWYTIEIRGVSLRGEGSPYIFPEERTIGEVPSRPRGFKLSQLLRIQGPPGIVYLAPHLSWSPPEVPNGKILLYRVAIRLVGPPEYLNELGPKVVTRNVTTLSYVTTKDDELGYGRIYSFEVSALNEINFGLTAYFNETMPEAKPTAQPSKLEIEAFRNTVTLRWLPPTINYRNGVITGYKICYYNIKDQKGSKEEIFVKPDLSYKITDLIEKTNYVFMIRAVNKGGEGPWSPSSSIYISSEFFPPPENIKAQAINDSKIKISWTYPEKSNFITDLQSQIIGFLVQISTNKNFGDENIVKKETTGPTTAIVINKITPNEYFIRVKAIIRDDRSTEWSNSERVLVKKSKYSDRNIRHLVCTGQNKRIKVTWTRPEEYVDISTFDVKVVGLRRYRGIDDTTQTQTIHARTAFVKFKPNEQYLYSYILDDLEPNTIYDVIITVTYISGSKNEPISEMTSCVTLMTKPPKVLSPVPIPQRKITDQVVLRLYRADEKYGRMSHYYLLVGPLIETHISPSDVSINKTIENEKQMKFSNYRYIVAQFTTGLFQSKSYVDFTLGTEDSIATTTFQTKDWMYYRNPPLQKKVRYKAFLRACIIADGLDNQSSDQTCTSSDWSTAFSTEINPKGDIFTIAVIAGIAGIILLVFVCIGFACFLKRSHSKVSRPMNSNDPCLKQPLMMQPGGTLPQYNNICITGNSSRHGYSDSLRTNSDLCAGTSLLTPKSNHQPLSVSNPMFEHRSLEMKKIANTPAPDLVQNAISISNSNRPAIAANRLEFHISELRANDNFLFSQEYESIDPGQQFTWENSNIEINRCKNRYANVIAYDHSRILLQKIDRIPGSDYINANYIDGYKRPNAYIASQGPLSNTFGDFWRMVWEQGTTIIVMMTKLEERTRIKCDQYWPNKGTETYADGRISVTLTETKELAYYSIRTFMISANYTSNTPDLCLDKEKREVRQYQFTAWPDHGVPENPMPLLMFLRRVRTGSRPYSGPIIVHCSAGVGRTGAFIAIDATLERIRYEMTVDIFGQVSLMRAQRNYMVQTEDQYVFVHDVVLDAVRAGNTEVLVQGISAHVQKLLRSDCSTQQSPGIELEFQKLSQFKASNARCTSANLTINRLKNRLVNILPYEYNRICLQPIRGCEGSDYINASYIDGYSNTKAYIATQAPLAETVEDFWRMIWEHNSTIVVMLTKLREMGREKCHRYWPTERSSRFQYFVVDPMVEYNMPNFVLQEFKVTDARDGQSRTVRQFQFTEWPEQGVPHQAREAFIDFIGQVHKTKEQFGQEGPITVHCSAGVGRTGVFMTLSIALERLRQEGVLDLFQTVRLLRYQRANMVQSEEQYRFCYLAAQDFVNSFDNFIE